MPLFGLHEAATVLVVAPHPDDETLGPGGTVARLAHAGARVHVLAVACQTVTGWGIDSDPDIRSKEFTTACHTLGVTGHTLAWTDARADNLHRDPRALVNLIESHPVTSLAALRPDALLIPAAGASHQDHQAVHHAAFAAARPGGTAKPTPRIVLGYHGPDDMWASTTPPHTVWIDTTAAWPAKRAALAAYPSQLRDDSHPRSLRRIQAADAARGAAIGANMAETFVAYRMAY